MELDVFEVLLGHAEHIGRIGKEYVAAFDVFRNILIFTLLEIVKLGIVVRLNPARFVKVNRLPTALRVVLMFKTILYNFELKLAYGTDDAAVVELVYKHLGHTFVHELLDAFLKLLRLHRVIILNILEQFGRE